MTENNAAPKSTPSTEETGEIPVVPEYTSPSTVGSTVVIRKDGKADKSPYEPEVLTSGDMATKLHHPSAITTRIVGDTLSISTDSSKAGRTDEVNEMATAVIRTFNPDDEPVYGDAVFSHNVGQSQTPLTQGESTLLLDTVTELEGLVADGYTPTPTARTRTQLLEAFDKNRAVIVDPEEDAAGDKTDKNTNLPWILTGIFAIVAVILGSMLAIQNLTSGSTDLKEEEPAPVTETHIEEAPAEEEAEPYDPSPAIEQFDKDRELNQRQKDLDQRQKDLDQWEKDVTAAEQAAQARSEQLDKREVSIAEQEDSLRDHQNRLDEAIAQFNEMQREANQNQDQSQDTDTPEEEDEGSIVDLLPGRGN